MKAADPHQSGGTAAAADKRWADASHSVGQFRARILGLVSLELIIDEYQRRLTGLSETLTYDEKRAVRDGMAEEYVGIIDSLTQPAPMLTAEGCETSSVSSKKLLEQFPGKHVRDWRRQVATTTDVNSLKRRVLDHVLTVGGARGESAYATRSDFQFSEDLTVERSGPLRVDESADDDVVARIHAEPAFGGEAAAEQGGRET
ncbi:hypothetical protein [Nocardioides sp. YIM 152588]|uniref:hypothetical protein n=1 Tax=Nocardioides sp. YIM 152588 TaxID=3158259 RepID=UPI0032E4CFF5